jgi:ribonuclease HI
VKLTLYSDGGARGNPGPAAIGLVIFNGEERVKDFKKCIGIGTNNQAEYAAMITALELCLEVHGTDIIAFSDSELMVKQLNGEYKVRNSELFKLWGRVKELEGKFSTVVFTHVFRENPGIVIADGLVNEALDGL